MAEYLTRDQIQESLESFALFDADSDGLINQEELDKALRSLGSNLSNQELNKVMQDLDEDGAGVIDFSKFLEIIAYQTKKNENFQEYLEICMVYDKDGEGRISESDLRHVFGGIIGKITDKELNELIEEVTRDCDGSGLIDYKEFLHFVMSKDESC